MSSVTGLDLSEISSYVYVNMCACQCVSVSVEDEAYVHLLKVRTALRPRHMQCSCLLSV